jgi:hypothetical protein
VKCIKEYGRGHSERENQEFQVNGNYRIKELRGDVEIK